MSISRLVLAASLVTAAAHVQQSGGAKVTGKAARRDHMLQKGPDAAVIGRGYLPALPISSLAPFDQLILSIHNAERKAVGAAPLHWDLMLAAHAMAYAQHLAQTQKLIHAPREERGIERENLQEALPGSQPHQLMQDWLGEKRYFHAGVFPDVCTGDWSQCAHYTQVIWPTTTSVGCGMAKGGGFEWFVCRYSPGGNRPGTSVGSFVRRTPTPGG